MRSRIKLGLTGLLAVSSVLTAVATGFSSAPAGAATTTIPPANEPTTVAQANAIIAAVKGPTPIASGDTTRGINFKTHTINVGGVADESAGGRCSIRACVRGPRPESPGPIGRAG